MRWTDVPIHFLDFEGSLSSGVLEYGIVTLRAGGIAATATRLCRATGRIGAEDFAIHHLDEAAVAGFLPFSADWEFFAGLRGQGPFAAHYAQAENTLIKSVWPYARHSPDFARPGVATADWGPWIDTGRLCPAAFPGVPSGKLADLIAALGLQPELDGLAVRYCPKDRRFYHAALYDALAGVLLLLAAGQTPPFAEAEVADLIEASLTDPEKRASLRQGELF